jgi:hypothetical protein
MGDPPGWGCIAAMDTVSGQKGASFLFQRISQHRDTWR